MTSQISRMAVEAMREVVGEGPAESELIRCLHLAKSDVPQAVNIFFDLATAQSSSRDALAARLLSSSATQQADPHAVAREARVGDHGHSRATTALALTDSAGAASSGVTRSEGESRARAHEDDDDDDFLGRGPRSEAERESRFGSGPTAAPARCAYTKEEMQEMHEAILRSIPPSFNDRVEARLKRKRLEAEAREKAGEDVTNSARNPTGVLAIDSARAEATDGAKGGWWFLGEGTVECLSQAKGNKLVPGQEVELSFPKAVQQQLQGSPGATQGSGSSSGPSSWSRYSAPLLPTLVQCCALSLSCPCPSLSCGASAQPRLLREQTRFLLFLCACPWFRTSWFAKNAKLNQRDLIIRFGTKAGGEVRIASAGSSLAVMS